MEWSPEVLVRVYRGDHLIEQRHSDSPEAVAQIVESWEARPPPEGERIVVEPHPPEEILTLLRTIADAIEQERPLSMPHPFPPLPAAVRDRRSHLPRRRCGESSGSFGRSRRTPAVDQEALVTDRADAVRGLLYPRQSAPTGRRSCPS